MRKKKKHIRHGKQKSAIRDPKQNAISEVLPHVTPNRKSKHDFDGDLIKMNSQRYALFLRKGVKCVICGIEGKYFYKEKFVETDPYHFNLYAVDDDGLEILMTKDHIIPRSKGGRDKVSNYQTMCCNCNEEKGSDQHIDFRYIFSQQDLLALFKQTNFKETDEWNHSFSIREPKSGRQDVWINPEAQLATLALNDTENYEYDALFVQALIKAFKEDRLVLKRKQ